MKNLFKAVTVTTLLLLPGVVSYYFHATKLGPVVFLLTFALSVTSLLYLKKRYKLKIDSRIRDEHAW